MSRNNSAKKKTKIALNGLGRIGRVFLRLAYNNPHFQITVAHSRSGSDIYAHLIKYDSTYGIWDKKVKAKQRALVIEDRQIPFVQEQSGVLPWKKYKIDIVVDATGKYTKRKEAEDHLAAGAKFMVVTAPMDDPDETFVLGVNEKSFDPSKHKIISAGSCTTVCTALTCKVLEENFGLEEGFINTVHAYTSDQSLLDSSHRDYRRARSAAMSIIPTSSGVSKTLAKLYPKLEGKFSALALRVPVPDLSVVVLTARLKKPATMESLKKAFTKASQNSLKGRLAVSVLPLVSRDFVGNPHGAIVDFYASSIVGNKLINLVVWYDNEWGYVSQTVSLLEYLAKRIAARK
jgi:glyceraldehyde 3-phosphate dehydrogenase